MICVGDIVQIPNTQWEGTVLSVFGDWAWIRPTGQHTVAPTTWNINELKRIVEYGRTNDHGSSNGQKSRHPGDSRAAIAAAAQDHVAHRADTGHSEGKG